MYLSPAVRVHQVVGSRYVVAAEELIEADL
jgi:hypothetical protein